MITIKYECETTGQKVTAKLTPKDDGAADMKIEFNPPVSDATRDPYGIIGRLLNSLQCGDEE